MAAPTRPAQHPSLSERVWLRPRRPRGWELTAIEIVEIPEGADADATLAEQLAAETRGFGPNVTGVLIGAWSSQRVPARQLAQALAMGRAAEPTEKVKTWQVYRLIGGRPHRVGFDQPTFDQAVHAFARAAR